MCCRAGELSTGVLSDDGGNSFCCQSHRSAVGTLLQQRNSFTPKSTDFSVRKNWFETVADLGTIPAVPDRDQDQHAAICDFAPNSPLLEQIHGVTLDVPAI